MDDLPTFGRADPALPVRNRPGAYAVILDEDERVFVMLTPKGYYLPGGGVDPGETHREALAREVLEETGHDIEVGPQVARAAQYIPTGNAGTVRKDGAYFLARLGPKRREASEPDHEPVWLRVDEAVERLVHAAQSWALRRAFERRARAPSSFAEGGRAP